MNSNAQYVFCAFFLYNSSWSLEYQVPNEAAELILIPLFPFLMTFFFWSSQKF